MTTDQAQAEAIKEFPDRAVKDSPTNKKFIEAVNLYKMVKPEYFNDSEWPLKLTRELIPK